MEWWHRMIFPVRKAWLAVSSRVKARKNGAVPPPPHIIIFFLLPVVMELLNQISFKFNPFLPFFFQISLKR